jgi:hypothetical protein
MTGKPNEPDQGNAVRFRAALDLIDWTPHGLARRLGVDESRTRRWMAGRYPVPADVLAWLETLAAFHKARPIPAGWSLKAAEPGPAP